VFRSTLHRTFTDTLDQDTVVRTLDAMARVRSNVWERIGT